MSFQNTSCLMSVFRLHPGLFSFLFILSLPFSFLPLLHRLLSFSVLLLSSLHCLTPLSILSLPSSSSLGPMLSSSPILTCSFILSTRTAFNFHFFYVFHIHMRNMYSYFVLYWGKHILAMMHLWRSEDSVWDQFSPKHHFSSRVQTQVIKLGNKLPSPPFPLPCNILFCLVVLGHKPGALCIEASSLPLSCIPSPTLNFQTLYICFVNYFTDFKFFKGTILYWCKFASL